MESTRDFEDQQQLDTADGLKAALLSNLALVAFQQEEYARSIEWCDKALNMDPENAKVRQCGVLLMASALQLAFCSLQAVLCACCAGCT
jgi:tetratricopeptide (TPR) repeat protein